MSGVRGRRPWRYALLACAALDVLALRAVWKESRPVPGQYRRGFFEEHQGAVGLTLDKQTSDHFFPDVYFDQNGRVSMPPGTSIGVLLETGREYRVNNDGSGLPPYLVLGRVDGRVAPTAPGRRDERERDQAPATRLVEGRRLEWKDEHLAWAPWEPARPFRDDEAWLQSLRSHCGSAGGAVVRSAGDALSIRLGKCSFEGTLAPDAEGRPPALAVISGTEWDTVEKVGGWDQDREIHGQMLGLVLLASLIRTALLLAGIGAVSAIAASVATAAAGLLFHPVLIAVGWELCAVVALLAAIRAGVARLLAGRSAWLRSAAMVAVVAAMVLGIFTVIRRTQRGAREMTYREDLQLKGPDHRCALTGYSTADDCELRNGTRGTWAYLAETCAACAGGALKYAHGGQTFPFVRDFVCAPGSPLKREEPLVFLGGSNDDFFYWANQRSPVAWIFSHQPLLVRFSYQYHHPSTTQLLELEHETALGSLALVDEQDAVLRDAIRCAHERGVRLLYFHDFLLLDLPRGRPPERAAMLERRRAAVESAGGTFVSLYDQLHEAASVSWFNDQIHLSSVGHRQVADLACRAMDRR